MDQYRGRPWVSFCISTFKRPAFLKTQISLLLSQTDKDFDIVVSDNDPDASAKSILESFQDERLRYFHNSENIGMIKSFNRSVERANTDYVVMVTDDDPIEPTFLAEMRQVITEFPGYSLYGGFIRAGKAKNGVEKIGKNFFLNEMLDPDKTTSLLWSSCILNRSHVLEIGCIPDFGSPHLADHALLAMTGSVAGGVMINKMFSMVTFHETNFSKTNFDYYTKGCGGFYNCLNEFIQKHNMNRSDRDIVKKHINKWFISNTFNLMKYYALRNDRENLRRVKSFASEIIAFPFMRSVWVKYRLKSLAFLVKWKLRFLS